MTKEESLIVDNLSAIDKLPAVSGTFVRGLKGKFDESFDKKYFSGNVLTEQIFASVSERLVPNYRGERVMVFDANNVKDVSALAMDVNFGDKIGQAIADSEYLIQPGHVVKVVSNDGYEIILEQLK